MQITNQHNASHFTANPGETILDAALRDNRLFQYGCRNGVCGACKSNLIAGKVDYGDYDTATLTADEIAAGKVLLCQAVALEDVVIDAQEIATVQNIRIRMLPCRAARLQKLADDVMQLFLQLPKSQEFNFLPGQYIDIVLKDGQRRSFSVANLPQDSLTAGLELHIRHVPGGHFTPRVFHSMRERDLLRLEGPFGTYLLQTDCERPAIMVAGGTGFAPIKALLLQAFAEAPDKSIHLFWGARDAQDLYLHSLATEWARANANFRYTPVLSEAKGDDWQGATGFVHTAVLAEYDSFDAFDVYASGPPVMVDAVRDSLAARGMDLGRFFFDSFTYSPR